MLPCMQLSTAMISVTCVALGPILQHFSSETLVGDWIFALKCLSHSSLRGL